MTNITMREFAILCRSDPELYKQTVAIPGTVTPEKVLSLARRNGYRIVPEHSCPSGNQIELLHEEDLERVTGGTGDMTRQEQLDALHTWLYYVMGFGSENVSVQSR